MQPDAPIPAHLTHEAPLKWLVREKLHPGTTLADRVRKLRWKRRKAKVVEGEVKP